MEEENDFLEVENPVEDQDSTPELDESQYQSDAELEKAKQIALNQRLRAEKAEKELKALKSQPAKEQKIEGNVSLKDIRALQSVHDDDVEKVEKWAKAEGISIAEAVKDPLMQTYFRNRNEERQSASTVNTGVTKRSNKETNESIVEDFRQGRVSEKDEDINKLVEAQFALRRKH